MTGLQLFLPFVLGSILLAEPAAFAKPTFISSEIEGAGTEILFADLDGDHLKDAVLIDGLNLSIYYQDAKTGFPRHPQQQYRLDDPALIWPARLGKTADSLLLLTSNSITELGFTNRITPPERHQIIQEPTIIPGDSRGLPVMYFPLSAETGKAWTLLLVPIPDGLQVWHHGNGWQPAQFIGHTVDTHIRPFVTNPGYSRSYSLNLSLNDVNGDGRDDLMVMREAAGGRQIFNLYLQQTNGLFTPEPVLNYTNKPDWRTTLCWQDINRDGRIDLIKSTVSDEPFFVPGLRSGKVLVAIYLADDHGLIPAEPQQVFRKNDWSSTLPVSDVDGDGFKDIVTGNIPINTREGARNMITAEQLDLNLKCYCYRPGTGFPLEADFQRNVAIHFHRGFLTSSERRLYYERYVNLNGDFNGDGKKDLLARDHSDEISVYCFISREQGFSSSPDFRFKCPEPVDWFDVKDLNDDGLSDLIVRVQERNLFRIFTSQKP